MNEKLSAIPPLSLQEEFAGVVARVVTEPGRDIESLRGRMGESTRQVDGLFESLVGRRLRRKSAPSRPSPNAEEHGIWGR